MRRCTLDTESVAHHAMALANPSRVWVKRGRWKFPVLTHTPSLVITTGLSGEELRST